MKNRGFYWEIKDILTQFVAAFDDTVISRYDKNRYAKETIEVRYVFGPKQRVMYDIINKAQNLTLPAIAVNITGITRDESRVFNKLEPSYLPGVASQYGPRVAKVPAPVPINIEVSMSILSRYMTDMDQILSNFVPYNNPYVILSWLLPEEFGVAYNTEIRSEVLWSGSVSLTEPTDLTYSDKFRIVGDTSFTIKTWLFKEAKDPMNIIYKVDANFFNVNINNKIIGYEDYATYSDIPINYDYTDVVTVSAIPSFTNLFYTTSGSTLPVYKPITIDRGKDNSFIVYGKRFDYNNTFYLSANTSNFYKDYTAVKTAKSPIISAYDITDKVSVLNDSIFTLNLPTNTLSAAGNFTIVSANSAGWVSTNAGYVITVE